MHYIGPLHSLLDDRKIGLGKLVAVRLHQSVEHRHTEVGQHIVGLRLVGLVVAARQHTHIKTCLFQICHGTSGRSGEAVSGRIVIIDNKQNFHS